MEKDQIQNQIADQKAEHLILPAAGQSKSDFALLMQTFCRHPFLLWGSLWTLLLLLISVTLSNFLLNPEFVAGEPLQETPVVVSPDASAPAPKSAEAGKDSLPLWSFGAIAFSCAVASLMVSQRLRQIPGPRKPVKRSSTNPQSLPAAQVAPLGRAIAPTSRDATPSQPTTALQSAAEEPLRVVPNGESRPPDWSEAGLTDSLDIRYRRPLSSWR
jgi:hypothetical protein